MKSVFLDKVNYNIEKKVHLIENSLFRYILRCILAGGYLTLVTIAGIYFADEVAKTGAYGKHLYAFIFSFGLLYILFLGGELATSNMMYLSAGIYTKKIKLTKAIKILICCLFFNLVGAVIFAFIINQTGTVNNMDIDGLLVNIVQKKLSTSNYNIIFSAILANLLVNIAIISYLLVEKEIVKSILVSAAVFMFVLLGYEHVVANFSSFSLIFFSKFRDLVQDFELMNILRHWGVSFIGNLIGGGILGLSYAYLNTTKINYKD